MVTQAELRSRARVSVRQTKRTQIPVQQSITNPEELQRIQEENLARQEQEFYKNEGEKQSGKIEQAIANKEAQLKALRQKMEMASREGNIYSIERTERNIVKTEETLQGLKNVKGYAATGKYSYPSLIEHAQSRGQSELDKFDYYAKNPRERRVMDSFVVDTTTVTPPTTEISKKSIQAPFQGPVRPGYSEETFRKTGKSVEKPPAVYNPATGERWDTPSDYKFKKPGYQGPVRPGIDEQKFRETGTSVPTIPDTGVIKPSTSTVSYKSTILRSGLPTVTAAEEKGYNLYKTVDKPYWTTSVETGVKDKVTEGIRVSQIDITPSPLPGAGKISGMTAGVFESNWAKIEDAKTELSNIKMFNFDVSKTTKEFQKDPLKFKDELGFKSEEIDGETRYTLGAEYFENLQSYKRLVGGPGMSGWEKARERRLSSSARNVRLTAGELGVWTLKKPFQYAEFGASILATGMSGKLEDGKISLGGVKKVSFGKMMPNTPIGRLMNVPTAPSTSGFRLRDPSSYKNVGAWVKELPNRPSTVMDIAFTTSVVGAGALGASKLYAAERAAGASKLAATSTVAEEITSSLAPYKIRSGIMATGYETPKSVARYNVNNAEGFVKLSAGKPTGLSSTPQIISSDKIIKGRTVLKNIDSSGGIAYPGEVPTKVVRASEEVFVWGSAKYGAGGLTPSLTGLRIPTVTYNLPITKLTSSPVEVIKGGSTSEFTRAQITTTKVPVQSSRYGFNLADETIATLQKGFTVSTPRGKVDLQYKTDEQLFVRNIKERIKIDYIDPTTKSKLEIDTGVVNLGKSKPKFVGEADSYIKLKNPLEVPGDVKKFIFKGQVNKQGIIYPSETISKIKVYGRTPYTETLRGYGETFQPNAQFGGGGRIGSSVSGGGSSPAGGSGSSFGDLSNVGGRFQSFNQPITSIPTSTPNFGPLSFSTPSTLSSLALGVVAPMVESSNRPPSAQSSATISSQALSTTTVPITTQASKPIINLTPTTSTTPITGQSPATTTTQITTPITTQITTPITTQITTPITTPITTTTPITQTPITPTTFKLGSSGSLKRRSVKKKKRKSQPGYYPEIKDKGKWKRIAQKPRTKNEALALAGHVVDNSTAVQLRIIKSKRKAIKETVKKRINRGKYRDYSIRGTKRFQLQNQGLIEKKKHRIDTLGEKKQLSAAKVLKGKRFKSLLKPKKVTQKKSSGGFGRTNRRFF